MYRTDAAAVLETLEVTGVVLSFIFVGHELKALWDDLRPSVAPDFAELFDGSSLVAPPRCP